MGVEIEKMDNKGCWEKGKEMRIHALMYPVYANAMAGFYYIYGLLSFIAYHFYALKFVYILAYNLF